MRSASKGAKKAGGLVIGILPNDRNRPIPGYPNEFVDIPIYTGLYEARNIINVKTPHVVVALSGGAGTISEMALAVKSGTPLISFGAPVCELEKSDFFRVVNSLEETLDEIEKVRQDIER